MKNFALVTLIALVTISCQDEDIRPEKSYAGFYSFDSGEVEFTFELIREHGIYKGIDAVVNHDSISGSEGRDNLVVLRYSDTRNAYNQIIIRSHAPVYWTVDLNEVVFTDEGMMVEEIRIMMPGIETTLQNQTVKRLNL